MLTIRDIQHTLDKLAPPMLAESWDNVGLLVGDPGQAVSTVLVALDVTARSLDAAAEHGAELLIVHHPLLFSPVKRLVEDGGVGSLLRRLVREGRSLLAAHTNLDSAPRGLNLYVGDLLGLREMRPLLPSEARALLKLVVYVPVEQAEAVRAAISAAGAGQIGAYSACTFSVEGIGTFRPGVGTHPFIGAAGQLERVRETRLETVVPRPLLGPVIAAMLAVHPYEEVAYDLLPLENRWPEAGLGRIGTLEAPTTAGAFCARVRATLHTTRVLLTGDPARPVRTVALCTGAGGDFLDHALRAGADLYLTGEVKHHQALLAREHGIALIDAGHFPTERPAVALMAEYLAQELPSLRLIRAEEDDPLEYLTDS